MSVTHQRSDEEMDREFQFSGRRPQSTMARHFSITLDDLFKIDNSIADLDAAVDQKCVSCFPSFLPLPFYRSIPNRPPGNTSSQPRHPNSKPSKKPSARPKSD